VTKEISENDRYRFQRMFTDAVEFGTEKLGWKGSPDNFTVQEIRNLDQGLLRKIFPRICVPGEDGNFVVNPIRLGLNISSENSQNQFLSLEEGKLTTSGRPKLYLESCPACGDFVFCEHGFFKENITAKLNNYRQRRAEARTRWAKLLADTLRGFTQPGVLTGAGRMRIASGIDPQSYAILELGPGGSKIVEWNIASPASEHAIEMMMD
jgi:hypothetical protein